MISFRLIEFMAIRLPAELTVHHLRKEMHGEVKDQAHPSKQDWLPRSMIATHPQIKSCLKSD